MREAASARKATIKRRADATSSERDQRIKRNTFFGAGDRVYMALPGLETPVSRFRHGWMLLRTTLFAYRKLKAL